jgi:hypothetical protein
MDACLFVELLLHSGCCIVVWEPPTVNQVLVSHKLATVSAGEGDVGTTHSELSASQSQPDNSQLPASRPSVVARRSAASSLNSQTSLGLPEFRAKCATTPSTASRLYQAAQSCRGAGMYSQGLPVSRGARATPTSARFTVGGSHSCLFHGCCLAVGLHAAILL